MKSKPYQAWFGKGDTKEDIANVIKENGKPEKIFIEKEGYMAAIVYRDKIICVGYDGSEYTHEFLMNEEIPTKEK